MPVSLLLHRGCSSFRWPTRWFALAVILILSPAAAFAAGIPFNDAVQLAVERAPLLRARQAQIIATQEEAVRAAALPDPTLSLGLSNWPVSGADAYSLHRDDMTMKQIGISQEFPARAKRQARQAVADRGVEQAQALSLSERLAVQRGAAAAWIELWAAQRQWEALQALKEPINLATRAAKARLSGGNGSVSDTLATQATALELDNTLDAANAAVQAARAGLARWLGDDPGTLHASGEPPVLTRLPADPARLLASIDQQGAMLPWRARQASAEAQVDAAIAEKRLDWRLGLGYGQRERMPNGMSRSDMLSLEVSVNLPLFPRDRQDRGIAARRAELDAVSAEREDARRQQLEGVHRALADWQGMKLQVDRKESQSLPLARDRTRIALAAYAAGGELQPWLQARRDEAELHVEHARHLAELGRAWAALAYLLPEERAQ
ncbi:TolC family protein [Stenotrophomonas maltophilia]